MKRTIALLLALASLLSLTACGGSAPAETKAPETTAPAAAPTEAPTETPTTEPTLSPEEVLYNSLPERTKQAVDVGIVELSQLEDLNRTVTVEESVAMLQKAFVLHNGTESKLLTDIPTLDYANEPACLGWVGRLPIALYVEALEPESYQDYAQWMNHVVDYTKNESLYRMLPPANLSLYWDDNSALFLATWGWFEIGWTGKMGNIFYEGVTPGNAQLEDCAGQGGLLALSALMYDQTTGHKLVECTADNTIAVEQVMTVETMTELALRMYHSFYTEPDPVPYEECVTADPSILTEELLSRETDLPDASCAHLPSEWRGVTLDDLRTYYDDRNFHYDGEIFEYEIQAVKDAGFNYIGLQLDFSWLQGSGCHRGNPLDGNLDLNRLKTLDQILAWCMERDLHLDIRCTDAGGYDEKTWEPWSDSPENAQKTAKIWGVLAQRYAQVPNTYLSFSLVDGMRRAHNDKGDAGFAHPTKSHWDRQKDAVAFVKPAVETIRAISPDRCMIMDISGHIAPGEEVLELGVALAADLTADNEFFIIHGDHYFDPSYYLNMQWPYNGTCTAESLMDEYVNWQQEGNLREIAAMAQDNGLGFMVSGWGEIPDVWVRGLKMPTVRYADAAYQGFIQDVAQTLQSYGYGWCYEEWYGTNGITFSAPLIQNVTYEQIGDYPMYYDTAMLGFFKEINGVQ